MSKLIPNGFIAVHGNHATLTFKRRLQHPIEAVWAAITDPEQRATCFGITMIDHRVGGTIETIAEGPLCQASRGRILASLGSTSCL